MTGRSLAKGISIHIGLNGVDPRYYSGWEARFQIRMVMKERIRKMRHGFSMIDN